MYKQSLKITKIPRLNTIVLKQFDSRDWFIASPTSIVISEDKLKFIISFLLSKGYISLDDRKEKDV